jgi:AraC-like DNA-binding protein
MTDQRPSRIHVARQGDDVVEAHEVLASAYDGIAWSADPIESTFSYRYSAAGDSAMTLRAVEFAGRLTGEMPAGEDFVVQWITRGSGVLGDGDDRLVLQPGRPQMWPNESFSFRFEDYSQRLVQMNRAAVEEIAAERGTPAAHLRFDHTATPDERAMRMWKDSVSLISRTVLDRDASPLLQAEMDRLAAVALLELYPLRQLDLPGELLLPRNAHLRLAAEYVHAHAHLPITSTELAAVAGVGLRALQQAFQRQLGLSPNAYIRQVRLDLVRDALLRGDPGMLNVGDVARQWGFAHAGRFSAAYLQRHGEYPKDTLRRSRATTARGALG